MNLSDLAAEFPRDAVSWRVQGSPYKGQNGFAAMALAYIDARDVQDRLDEVCGPENWQDKYEVLPSGLYIAKIGIRVDDQWVWKADGAGETAVEGKKGGISDAFKRAGVKWGIGRYLYRLDSPWVNCAVRTKGDKTYWKEWTEDPWSKVKTSSYIRAEAEKENALVSAAVSNIESVTNLDDLKSYYQSLSDDLRKHSDVKDATARMKTQLSQKDAA